MTPARASRATIGLRRPGDRQSGHARRPPEPAQRRPFGRTRRAHDPGGDLRDWFRVSLARDQTIRLQIAENGTTNDLDLELRQLNESLVASSATESRTEEIPVETTGDYYVVVVVRSGFSNYTLTIGQAPLSAGPASEPAFVPGQVLVRYRDDAAGRRGGRPGARTRRRDAARLREPDGPMLFAAETVAERREAFEALGLALTAEMRGAPDRAASGAGATTPGRSPRRCGGGPRSAAPTSTTYEPPLRFPPTSSIPISGTTARSISRRPGTSRRRTAAWSSPWSTRA